jgi:hypothetical protein
MQNLKLKMLNSTFFIFTFSFKLPALPTGLRHARDLAFEAQEPETDPAHPESSKKPPHSAADGTAIVRPDLEFLRGHRFQP